MEASHIYIGLLILNIVSFVSARLHLRRHGGRLGALCMILAVAGGSAGVFIASVLFGKTEKSNALSRVLLACLIVWQALALFVTGGGLASELTFDVGAYFSAHRILLIYLAGINIAAFIMYAVDKARAADHGSRVSIAALLTAAFIGGSVGALAAMYILRHKTRKTYFTVGVPLMLLTQLAALFCLINAA